jgi:molybdopterin synthase catalytic subunit
VSAFRLNSVAIDTAALRAELADPSCGGYACFEGWVRDHNDGQRVTRLAYEAFAPLAQREGERIIAEARAQFGLSGALCVHRVGTLELGEVAVWVGVAAPHRDEAFRGCRYIIDEVKHRLPIWKKEHYANGDSGWVNCERCAAAPSHGDQHGETAPGPGHAAPHVHAKPR